MPLYSGGNLTVANLVDGWIGLSVTASYSSWSSTTKIGVINVSNTSYFSVGMKIKFNQPTDGTKYGVIMEVGSSTISVFMGQNYDLDNESISNIYVSLVKCPVGFVPSENIWVLKTEITTETTKTSAAPNNWYNTGSYSLIIPIGIWKIRYSAFVGVIQLSSAATWVAIRSTLSTTTNSETHSQFTSSAIMGSASSTSNEINWKPYVESTLTLTSQTTFYLLLKQNNSASAAATLRIRGGSNWEGIGYISAVPIYI